MTLLQRLLPARDHEALLGDLHEERRRGRSIFWYWSQILAAIVIGSWRDVREHPLLALRAVMTGVVVLALYFAFVVAIGRLLWVLSNGGYYVGGHWLTLPPRPIPQRYDLPVVLIVNACGYAVSGWAIVRLHRAYGLVMAMPFLLVVSLLSLIPLTVIAVDAGSGARTMPLIQVACLIGGLFATVSGGVLLGALWGARRARRSAVRPASDAGSYPRPSSPARPVPASTRAARAPSDPGPDI
jgi:hypothetical protein